MDSYNNTGEGKFGLETTIKDLLIKERETISTRLANALNLMYHHSKSYVGRKIKDLGGLVNLKEVEVLQIPNFGEGTLKELNSILAKYKLPNINADMSKKNHESWRGKYY